MKRSPIHNYCASLLSASLVMLSSWTIQGAGAQDLAQEAEAIGRLNCMETKYFGAENISHSLNQRIDRLESMIFGQATKNPLQGRIERLEKALGTAKPSNVTALANSSTLENNSQTSSESSQITGCESIQFASSKPSIKPSLKPIFNAASKIERSNTYRLTTPVQSYSAYKTITPVETFASLSQLAVHDYAAKRYHAAADHLMQALQHNNSDARTYYRLGDVLTKLQDTDGAKEAYQAAFSVDPLGSIGAMAKQQLLARAKSAAYQASAPQDTPKVVARTVGWINRQSDDLSGRYNREGRDWQQWRGYLAGIEAAKIEQETELALAGLNTNTNSNWRGSKLGGGYGYHNNARHNGNGGGYGANNSASQYDREEISNLGAIRSNYVRTDGTVQGSKAMLEATTKAANVQESAANLKDLMLQQTKPGGANLKALGTNLYVRYYGEETPSYDYPIVPDDPMEELRARALRLSSR